MPRMVAEVASNIQGFPNPNIRVLLGVLEQIYRVLCFFLPSQVLAGRSEQPAAMGGGRAAAGLAPGGHTVACIVNIVSSEKT